RLSIASICRDFEGAAMLNVVAAPMLIGFMRKQAEPYARAIGCGYCRRRRKAPSEWRQALRRPEVQIAPFVTAIRPVSFTSSIDTATGQHGWHRFDDQK